MIKDLQAIVERELATFQGVAHNVWGSQRTSADQIEHAVREQLLSVDSRFQRPVGPRAPGDIMWRGTDTVHINIKTTDLDKAFHMPNLISADNLWRIFERGEHFFLLKIFHRSGQLDHTEFWNIKEVDWNRLQVSALGSGQIQIRNGMTPLTAHQGDHDHWVKRWQQEMIKFYHKEITKINKRIGKWEKRL